MRDLATPENINRAASNGRETHLSAARMTIVVRRFYQL
ncbi:hypothetical protein BN938_1666 [Mucinivorans hirudinis]|uniref:Uncharacterized protein n=1 Tax=Mucinivorans hirudinis TaxID=1433126 RepID=A0A060R8E0_9BACT|nr:hypothetical protein BN938_1666 [Mucinivorans hirudinis]